MTNRKLFIAYWLRIWVFEWYRPEFKSQFSNLFLFELGEHGLIFNKINVNNDQYMPIRFFLCFL